MDQANPKKDEQRITAQWDQLDGLIDGVRVREFKNVITGHLHLTELFRGEWEQEKDAVGHMVHVVLQPGAVTAWHMHKTKTDRIVAPIGMIRLVLYDGREESPTHGQVNEFNMGPLRPMVVTFPPGIWHGFQNLLTAEVSSFLNLSERPYDYENPDEWRLPLDTPEIPYTF